MGYEQICWNYYMDFMYSLEPHILDSFLPAICRNPMLIWRESPTVPNVMSLGTKFRVKNALPVIQKFSKGSLFKRDIMHRQRLREKNASAAIANIMERTFSLSVLILQNLIITLTGYSFVCSPLQKRMQGLS